MIIRFGIVLSIFAVAAFALPAESAGPSGRASLGVSGGGMAFLSGDEFGDGDTRFIGHAVFKYNLSSHWAGVLESGWGWNAYSKDRANTDTLATVIPSTLGLEYRTRFGETKIWPHLGFGGGLYSLGVKDSFRTWATANNGRERLTWTSGGVYGKFGAELLFDNGVSINLDLLYHQIFSEDAVRFPDKWGNQNTSFAEARLGVNYYFALKASGPAPPGGE